MKFQFMLNKQCKRHFYWLVTQTAVIQVPLAICINNIPYPIPSLITISLQLDPANIVLVPIKRTENSCTILLTIFKHWLGRLGMGGLSQKPRDAI